MDRNMEAKIGVDLTGAENMGQQLGADSAKNAPYAIAGWAAVIGGISIGIIGVGMMIKGHTKYASAAKIPKPIPQRIEVNATAEKGKYKVVVGGVESTKTYTLSEINKLGINFKVAKNGSSSLDTTKPPSLEITKGEVVKIKTPTKAGRIWKGGGIGVGVVGLMVALGGAGTWAYSSLGLSESPKQTFANALIAANTQFKKLQQQLATQP